MNLRLVKCNRYCITFRQNGLRFWPVLFYALLLIASSCKSQEPVYSENARWGSYYQVTDSNPKAPALQDATVSAKGSATLSSEAEFSSNTQKARPPTESRQSKQTTLLRKSRPVSFLATAEKRLDKTRLPEIEKKHIQKSHNDGRKVLGIAIAGFVLTVLAVASVFLALYWWPMVFVGASLGVLGLIFSIAAVVKLIRNPEKYKGRGWAIAGLVTAILYLSILSLLLDAYFSQGIE